MHTPRAQAAPPWLRLLGVALTLPLVLTVLLLAPAYADDFAPQEAADITATGRYYPGGEGCSGENDADGCLTWGLHVPSAAVAGKDVTLTIEADSEPGKWAWTCPSEDHVAGTAAYFTSRYTDAPIERLASSDLRFFAKLYYTWHGDSVGEVKAVTCAPGHLSLTYQVDFQGWVAGSYLDLTMGATALAPGAGARDYSFTPTVTVSDGTSRTPVATVQKPAADTAHATVTIGAGMQDDTAKDAGHFTATVRNDSTSPMSDFTVTTSRTRGPASVTSLSCDLSAYGGEVVTAVGPAPSLTVSSGKASVPGGKEVTCQVDLSGVVGRNAVTTGVTVGGQTFTGEYTDNRAVTQVAVTGEPGTTEVHDPDVFFSSPYVRVDYTVTFTNQTDADGRTSGIVLRPRTPAGFQLSYVSPTSGPWWFRDDYLPGADGSVRMNTAAELIAGSSMSFKFSAYYKVDPAAMTKEAWDAAGTCVTGDTSKGLSAEIDVETNGSGVDATTYPTCTAVTQPKG